MDVKHHGLKIVLPEEWWAEAGMARFVRESNSYRVGQSASESFEVSVNDVGPVRRNSGVGIFNDGEEGTARERVIRILRGFQLGEAIPVEIVGASPSSGIATNSQTGHTDSIVLWPQDSRTYPQLRDSTRMTNGRRPYVSCPYRRQRRREEKVRVKTRALLRPLFLKVSAAYWSSCSK
jgi:hypothetical protein